MVTSNQYQIIFGYRTEKKAQQLSFDSKAERDEHLIRTGGDMAIAAVDIELSFDDDYNLTVNNTTVFPLTQNAR